MPRKRKEQPDNYGKSFPSAIRQLMQQNDTTHQELADFLGKSRQAISYYCDGSSSPDWETLAAISKFFSVSTDYLLGITTEKTTDQTVQSVCRFTGLSADSVEYLHTHKASGRGFIHRLIDDIFLSDDIDIDVPDLIIKSAQALALSIMSSGADETKSEINNRIAVLSGKDGCQYMISARDASDLYMQKAIEKTTSEIADTLNGMREDILLEICHLQNADVGYFDFFEIAAKDERKETE